MSPVIRKNEAATTVNVKDGESFAIAGLINNEVRQAVAKMNDVGVALDLSHANAATTAGRASESTVSHGATFCTRSRGLRS